MKATVLVRPKEGIRDVDLEVDIADANAARAQIERMCGELLANPLIESFEIRLGGA